MFPNRYPMNGIMICETECCQNCKFSYEYTDDEGSNAMACDQDGLVRKAVKDCDNKQIKFQELKSILSCREVKPWYTCCKWTHWTKGE